MINPNEMIAKTVVNVVQMYRPFISIQTEEVLAEMQRFFTPTINQSRLFATLMRNKSRHLSIGS